MAAKGEIPGAIRSKSGRWRLKNSPELDEWVERTHRRVRGLWRHRILHRDETEIRKLEWRLARIRTSGAVRAKREKVEELTKLIAEKRAAVTNVMTTGQVADAVRRSRRWVTRMAPKIPGTQFLKNKIVFLKSDALAQWIKAQRRISELDRKMIKGDARFRQSPIGEACHAFMRCQRDIRRCMVFHPFDTWPPGAQQRFISNADWLFKNVHQLIQ
jgi:hypothetical protein